MEGSGQTSPHTNTLLWTLLMTTSESHILYHVPVMNLRINLSSTATDIGALAGLWSVAACGECSVSVQCKRGSQCTSIPRGPALCHSNTVWGVCLLIGQREVAFVSDFVVASLECSDCGVVSPAE